MPQIAEEKKDFGNVKVEAQQLLQFVNSAGMANERLMKLVTMD